MGDTVVDEPLVQDVEHLKEGAVRRDIVDGIGLEMALGAGVLLTPNMQFEVHSCLFFDSGHGTSGRGTTTRVSQSRVSCLFIVTGGDLNVFVIERLFLHGFGLAVALVFPRRHIHEVLVIAEGLGVSSLVLGAEMATT